MTLKSSVHDLMTKLMTVFSVYFIHSLDILPLSQHEAQLKDYSVKFFIVGVGGW